MPRDFEFWEDGRTQNETITSPKLPHSTEQKHVRRELYMLAKNHPVRNTDNTADDSEMRVKHYKVIDPSELHSPVIFFLSYDPITKKPCFDTYPLHVWDAINEPTNSKLYQMVPDPSHVRKIAYETGQKTGVQCEPHPTLEQAIRRLRTKRQRRAWNRLL